jgi:hypothetical protein
MIRTILRSIGETLVASLPTPRQMDLDPPDQANEAAALRLELERRRLVVRLESGGKGKT